MNFDAHFARMRGDSAARPFPYQTRLATLPWPELLDIPTGLGKTAAILAAWTFKRAIADAETPRRLVYCLPMRSLVEQTVDEAERCVRNLDRPIAVHTLLGGVDRQRLEDFLGAPEQEAILVGTQDMLLSRALNRGYGMSRYLWPMAFGLLHTDAMWVFDETQLMGVGVETSAQLEGLRRRLGTSHSCRSLWVSATLGREQIATVDHPEPSAGFGTLELDPADRAHATVVQRVSAKKSLERASVTVPAKASGIVGYAESLAELVVSERAKDARTIVILNRVPRAQALMRALAKRLGSDEELCLVHSRFRRADRRRAEERMRALPNGIVVATQAIEAGVDISSATMFTELAPWSSLVQRFGRLNRYGEQAAARCFWIDLESLEAESTLPYEPAALETARGLLGGLSDVGPAAVRGVVAPKESVVRPVLRRRDLLDLFDTTPELLGHDLDVGRFIRDSEDLDLSVAWRAFEGRPSDDAPPVGRDELCAISIKTAKSLLERLTKAAKDSKTTPPRAYVWDPLGDPGRRWVPVQRVAPGQTWLLPTEVGGYDPKLGYTGNVSDLPVDLVAADADVVASDEDASADPATEIGTWVALTDHLDHVATAARALVAAIGLDASLASPVEEAARFHDVGKAHPEFQNMLAGVEGTLWAKSDRRGGRTRRPGFRHEWASALAWLQTSEVDRADRDLIAYLIAAHHGKVRVSVRSSPIEQEPPDRRPYARGVWHGDELPSVAMPGGGAVPALSLDLGPVRLGRGSWLELTTSLRDAPSLGPFRLAFLETLVRIADWRASRDERRSASLDERMPLP